MLCDCSTDSDLDSDTLTDSLFEIDSALLVDSLNETDFEASILVDVEAPILADFSAEALLESSVDLEADLLFSIDFDVDSLAEIDSSLDVDAEVELLVDSTLLVLVEAELLVDVISLVEADAASDWLLTSELDTEILSLAELYIDSDILDVLMLVLSERISGVETSWPFKSQRLNVPLFSIVSAAMFPAKSELVIICALGASTLPTKALSNLIVSLVVPKFHSKWLGSDLQTSPLLNKLRQLS